jgi:hypothetical protein
MDLLRRGVLVGLLFLVWGAAPCRGVIRARLELSESLRAGGTTSGLLRLQLGVEGFRKGGRWLLVVAPESLDARPEVLAGLPVGAWDYKIWPEPASWAVWRLDPGPLPGGPAGVSVPFISCVGRDAAPLTEWTFAVSRLWTGVVRSERLSAMVLFDLDGRGLWRVAEVETNRGVGPQEPAQLRVLIPSRAPQGMGLPARVLLADRFGNLSGPFRRQVLVRPYGPGRTRAEVHWLELEDGRSAVLPISPRFTPGVGLVEVELDIPRLRARSNRVVISEDFDEPRQIFWGDIGGHSGESDGLGTPGALVANARAMGLDFHMPLDDLAQLAPYSLVAWEAVAKAMARPGEFTVLPGWELDAMGTRGVIGTEALAVGRSVLPRIADPYWRSVRKAGGLLPRLRPAPTGAFTIRELQDALVGRAALAVIKDSTEPRNIPGVHFIDDRVDRLFEIYSTKGSRARVAPGEDRSPFDHQAGAEELLQRGFRVGFVAGSACRDGRPGWTTSGRGPGGLTAVWAERNTPTAIMEALAQRHCYATTGARIYLEFSYDGRPMGSEVRVTDREGYFVCHIYGTADLARVEFLRNGRAIEAYAPNRPEMGFSYLDQYPPPTAYYTVHVVQRDGHEAWSSPIWVDRREVPRIRTLHMEEAKEGSGRLEVVWSLEPGSRARELRLLERLGNDGGGDPGRYEVVRRERPPQAAGRHAAPELPPGAAAFYILELELDDGVVIRRGPVAGQVPLGQVPLVVRPEKPIEIECYLAESGEFGAFLVSHEDPRNGNLVLEARGEKGPRTVRIAFRQQGALDPPFNDERLIDGRPHDVSWRELIIEQKALRSPPIPIAFAFARPPRP